MPHDSSQWLVILSSEQRSSAETIARNLVHRLRDATTLRIATKRAEEQTSYPFLLTNYEHGLACGHAGLAILCSYLDCCFPDENWDTTGHEHLQVAVRAIEGYFSRNPNLSLFSGLSGVMFAAWTLSRSDTPYQRVLAALEQKLLPRVTALAEHVLAERIHGCSPDIYDIVSGLTGLGCYLLCRRTVPTVLPILHLVLHSLVYLADEEQHTPHWHIPLHLSGEKSWKETYPDGHVNLGLAHGIPGPLVLMALAKSQGIEVPGLDAAITRTADCLMRHHIEDEWGLNWNVAYPLGRFFSFNSPEPSSSRTAWCYGIPGLARSLWLAGRAVGRMDYKEAAVAAMQAAYRQPLSLRRIPSPSFCHGVAGLLHITLRFANDTSDPSFTEAAQHLSTQLIELYQPESLLGYRHEERSGVLIDHPWLLDGSTGIALVLLAATQPHEPIWDRLFALA